MPPAVTYGALQAFIRADLYAGVGINGSVSSAQAPEFCFSVCELLFLLHNFHTSDASPQTMVPKCMSASS
jgi:hypothetical protein